MSQGHPILAQFQAACQMHYVCFSLATEGLAMSNARFANVPPGTRMFFSEKDPTLFPATASLQSDDLLRALRQDGAFTDALAKSLLVVIYSEWDEYYRPNFAKALGRKKNSVRCDLLGDLRLVRNCVVHGQSIITDEHTKVRHLAWQLAPGRLVVTSAMFMKLIDQLNQLKVEVLAEV